MSDTAHFERVSVESNGVRIPYCPRCGAPNVIPHGLRRATFGRCAGDDCDAWLGYDVSITAVAFDERDSAKYHFETYIEDDD